MSRSKLTRSTSLALLPLGLSLALADGALAQQQRQTARNADSQATAGEVALAVPPDTTVVTRHTGQFNGQTVRYTATAGTLPIVEDGKVRARMFYVAYVKEGVQDVTKRPVIFSFNGGPGSASVWMHMGYTGPKLVTYDKEGFALMPPGGVVDNPYSILDVADIVYIDPVATGFSRMMPGEDEHKYHGVMEDIQSVGEFIRLWVTRNGRWGSPKFLIGESYGTTRAAGLADYLQSRHRMYLNGVILVSMTNLGVQAGPLVSFATTLPHYTATAWYHGKLPPDLQSRPLREVLDEAEEFAIGDYLLALVKGHHLQGEERREMVRRVARYTGLSERYVDAADLRIDLGRFRKELLRDRRLTVGRLDSRYTGIDSDAAGERNQYDQAMSDWNGAFTTAVNMYLRETLGFKTDLEYNIFGDVHPWRGRETNVGQMLRRAMTDNPYLKVLVQAGYYDGGTDYFSAQYTMSQLQPGGELRDRIRFAFYESGHMMYLRREDLPRANQDIRDFIAWALQGVPDYPRVPARVSASAGTAVGAAGGN